MADAPEQWVAVSVVRSVLTRSNSRAHAHLLLDGALLREDLAVTDWVDEDDLAALRQTEAAAAWVHDELNGLMDSLDDSVTHEQIYAALVRLWRALDDPSKPYEEN